MQKLIFSLLFLFSVPGFAGDRVGNGGDVVVCADSKVRMLEDYEMQDDLIFKGKTLREKVQSILRHITSFDPVMATHILTNIESLLLDAEEFGRTGFPNQSVTEFTDAILVNIEDSDHFSLGEGCRIEQLIIHNRVPLTNQKKFLISKRYWRELDLDQQALAVLHEGWYIQLSKYGETNSRLTRHMNITFSSIFFFEYKFGDYLRDIHTAKNFVLEYPHFHNFKMSYYSEVRERRQYDNRFKCAENLLRIGTNSVVLYLDPRSMDVAQIAVDENFRYGNKIRVPNRLIFNQRGTHTGTEYLILDELTPSLDDTVWAARSTNIKYSDITFAYAGSDEQIKRINLKGQVFATDRGREPVLLDEECR